MLCDYVVFYLHKRACESPVRLPMYNGRMEAVDYHVGEYLVHATY